MSLFLEVSTWVFVSCVIAGVFFVSMYYCIEHDGSTASKILAGLVAILSLCVGFTLLIHGIQSSEKQCASNESLVSKREGKVVITKCVPDKDLAFVFSD